MPPDPISTILKHHQQNRLHHAYLIIANPVLRRPDLEKVIETILGVPLAGNADYWSHHAESFGIDASHDFRLAQSRRAFGARRCFLIGVQLFTDQAENALLKTVEEPIAGNHFFILTPSLEAVCLTLRSRCHIIQLPAQLESNPKVLEFLAASTSERLRFMEKLLPQKSASADEKRALKRALGQFCTSLEITLQKKYPVDPTTLEMYESLLKLKNYLSDNGAAVRLIAEHLALMLPPATQTV